MEIEMVARIIAFDYGLAEELENTYGWFGDNFEARAILYGIQKLRGLDIVQRNMQQLTASIGESTWKQ